MERPDHDIARERSAGAQPGRRAIVPGSAAAPRDDQQAETDQVGGPGPGSRNIYASTRPALLLGLRQHRFQQGLAELLRHRAVHGVPHSAQTATLVVELVEQAQDDLQGIVL